MKVTKVLSAILCGGLLSVGTSNASVIANSEISVSNLAVAFFDSSSNQLTPGLTSSSDIVLSGVDISFTGTSVSTSLNNNNDGGSFTSIITSPFTPLAIDLQSSQVSGANLANAEAKLNGNLLTTGASGLTASDVEVYGTSSGDANSQIVNNLETTFNFSLLDDVFINLSFDWLFKSFVSVFEQGGEGVATWDLTIALQQTGNCGINCSRLIGFDLVQDELNRFGQSGTLNEVGEIWDVSKAGTFDSGLTLLAAGSYVLNISQNTSSAAVSVPAPASLLLLGLGLLTAAGFSRKKLK